MFKLFKGLAIAAFILGLIFGTVSPTKAVPVFSFAGFHQVYGNRGTRADIGFTNPNVPTGQSLEWVMSDDNGHGKWVQIGWIKRSIDSAPLYFGEYGCDPTVCRTIDVIGPNGATHDYQISLDNNNANWNWRIDGVWKGYAPWQVIGFQQAARMLYEGETSDTAAQLGGTAGAHLRLLNTRYSSAPGVWNQVNPANFIETTTKGTCYRASKGTAGSSTFVDNWTLSPC